jgi:hypothetical protein
MIISLGINCDIATILKNNNLRTMSFPFDWIVTYNGVSHIIENRFEYFLTSDCESKYNIESPHFDIEESKEVFTRRIKRFLNILSNSSEKIIFVRTGHEMHHCGKNKCDYKDAEDLDIVLKKNYPHLEYEIITILACGNCYEPNKEYKSESQNIKFFNISSDKPLDMNDKFKFVTNIILSL